MHFTLSILYDNPVVSTCFFFKSKLRNANLGGEVLHMMFKAERNLPFGPNPNDRFEEFYFSFIVYVVSWVGRSVFRTPSTSGTSRTP